MVTDPLSSLCDIYTQWHTPFWQKPWFSWGVFSITVIIIFYIFYKIASFFKSKKKEVPYWIAAQKQVGFYVDKSLKISTKDKYTNLIATLKWYFTKHYEKNFISASDIHCIYLLSIVTNSEEIQKKTKELLVNSVELRFSSASDKDDCIVEDGQKVQEIIALTQVEKKELLLH